MAASQGEPAVPFVTSQRADLLIGHLFLPACLAPSLFLSGLCDNIIQDIIYTYLVLPNRITIPLVGETQLAQLRFPVPKVTRPAS